MLRAIDHGDYYRIPADTRDLNYDAYFTEGIEPLSQQEDYNSHNTRRLTVDEMAEMLRELEYIRGQGAGRRSQRLDIESENQALTG
jgi:UDP-glucose 4-epimerase